MEKTFITNAGYNYFHIYMQAIINSKRTDLYLSPHAYDYYGRICPELFSLHHIPTEGEFNSENDLASFFNEVEKIRKG